MKTYPTKKLGEVCEINPVKSEVKNVSDDSLVSFVPMSAVSEITQKIENQEDRRLGEVKKGYTYFGKGDILFAKITPCMENGKVAFADNIENKIGFASTEFHVIRPGEKVLPKYVFYLVASKKFRDVAKTKMTGSAGQKRVPKSFLENYEIPLPPLVEQKKIVAKLERVLGKIREAKKLRAEAQSAAQNLLPAELHKIFSTPHYIHPYKPENVGMSSASKNDWHEKELGEICEINPKKSELKNESDDLPVSFVPMAAVNEFTQEITSLGERKLGEVRKGYTYFRDGDVLFAKITPCMENGKVAIARSLKNGIGFGTTEFHVIRPKAGVLSEWIYAIIRHPEFRDIAKTKMTGSAGQKRVPMQFLETYKIPLPPLAEQRKIVARLDALSAKIQALRQVQTRTTLDFAVLEQSILSKAFSGSI